MIWAVRAVSFVGVIAIFRWHIQEVRKGNRAPMFFGKHKVRK